MTATATDTSHDNSTLFFVKCAICDGWITTGELGTGVLADHEIFKGGELQYIEIAHLVCVKSLNNTEGWEWDYETPALTAAKATLDAATASIIVVEDAQFYDAAQCLRYAQETYDGVREEARR